MEKSYLRKLVEEVQPVLEALENNDDEYFSKLVDRMLRNDPLYKGEMINENSTSEIK